SLAVVAQDSRPSGSLLLSRKALASSTSYRFIPAHINLDYTHNPGIARHWAVGRQTGSALDFQVGLSPDTFQRRFHSTSHEIMGLGVFFSATTKTVLAWDTSHSPSTTSGSTVVQAPFTVVFHATDQGIRGS